MSVCLAPLQLPGPVSSSTTWAASSQVCSSSQICHRSTQFKQPGPKTLIIQAICQNDVNRINGSRWLVLNMCMGLPLVTLSAYCVFLLLTGLIDSFMMTFNIM